MQEIVQYIKDTLSDKRKKPKILVTGGTGQLGIDVIKLLETYHINYVSPTRNEFDLLNSKQMNEYILQYKPTHIIHCAAYTAVDQAETDRKACYDVNVVATEKLAILAKIFGIIIVYISTDYVFDGLGTHFHTINESINPINWYGRTKAEGEAWIRNNVRRHFIIRVSWLFSNHGNNFVKTMIRLGNERESLSVVDDQIGSPTYTVDVAHVILQLLGTQSYGTYHVRNEGICSWADFAQEIVKQQKIDCKIHRIPSVEYPTPAKRPLNSRLDMSQLIALGITMPTWQDALYRMLAEWNESHE